MSRQQPPLPKGLPPRPSASASAPGGNRGNADTYRPRDQSPPRYRDQPGQGGMYHFRGAAAAAAPGTENYRPSYDERRSPPRRRSPARYDGYAPNYDDAPSRPRDEYSSYRPSYNEDRRDRNERNERSDGFTFRQEAPPNLDFSQANNHRARSPRKHFEQINGDSFRANNRNGAPRGGARGNYRGRAGPRLASQRDFLKTNREKTPELMPGMDVDNVATTYKNIDSMSESDETDMDISDSDDEQNEQPRKKLKAAGGDSVPRWSNPDPYTVLPPPDAADRKKKDVVKLIRKARVVHELENIPKPEADTDDFISFDDFNDDDATSKQPDIGSQAAPLGPRSTNTNILPPLQDASTVMPNYQRLPPPPGLANNPNNTNEKRSNHVIDLAVDPNLGNRKRTRSDVLKAPPKIHAPTTGKGAPRPNGNIVKSWQPVQGASPTPWVTMDHSKTVNMGVWLHKEIMDFYHYVKPRDFEQVVRQKLIDNLRDMVKKYYESQAEILPFGSFPAGLYLPTADMDLVCCSTRFLDGGHPRFNRRADLWRFADFLKTHKLALGGQVEVISGAKVPLVKYVCATTGLKVDISFENDTGLVANKTFQDWKVEFPAMPILVTLIKHLLAMRGLNEPVNGGIGGFSVICLVVSLLQHMPQVQSGTMIAEHHLGEVLMEFLDLYGNEFNTMTTAIQLKPPAYVLKSRMNIPYKKPEQAKFSIIDPNKADNDISGGSSNTASIRKSFSEAYTKLQSHMSQLHGQPDASQQSVLGCIIGGNYSTFELQREHLAHVHEHLFGPVSDK